MKQNMGGALRAATGDSVLKSRPSEMASHIRMSLPAALDVGGNHEKNVTLLMGTVLRR